VSQFLSELFPLVLVKVRDQILGGFKQLNVIDNDVMANMEDQFFNGLKLFNSVNDLSDVINICTAFTHDSRNYGQTGSNIDKAINDLVNIHVFLQIIYA